MVGNGVNDSNCWRFVQMHFYQATRILLDYAIGRNEPKSFCVFLPDQDCGLVPPIHHVIACLWHVRVSLSKCFHIFIAQDETDASRTDEWRITNNEV